MLDDFDDGRVARWELLEGDEARRSRHERVAKLGVRLWGGLSEHCRCGSIDGPRAVSQLLFYLGKLVPYLAAANESEVFPAWW